MHGSLIVEIAVSDLVQRLVYLLSRHSPYAIAGRFPASEFKGHSRISLGACVAWSAHHTTGKGARMHSVPEYGHAIDDNITDARGQLLGVVKGGGVGDGIGIKN